MTLESQSEIPSSNREEYHIPTDIIIEDFEEHLSISDNRRIFFSAKFGTGKSYFLEEFFDKKKDEYEVIKLYPVNYSTASNNDIFELIKFDILFHLIMKRQETIGTDIQLPELFRLQAYIHQKLTIEGVDTSLSLISALSALSEGNIIAKVAPLIINTFLEEKKKYQEYKNKIESDSLSKADDFLSKIYQNTKEYGDDEPITAIIKEALAKLNNTKKTVLLIDDLDRLDPEHIFRILNVFGNHLSSSSGNKFFVNENKFGFDKIILVGDVKNIMSVFEHRYGTSADFEGYFSKFFSKHVYNLDIKKIILEHDEYGGDKLNLKSFNLLKIPKPIGSSEGLNPLTLEGSINDLFYHFLINGQINFRHLVQKQGLQLLKIKNIGMPNVENSYIFKLSEFFITFFNSKENFIRAITNSADFVINDAQVFGANTYRTIFSDLIIYNFHEVKTYTEYQKILKQINTNSNIGRKIELELYHVDSKVEFTYRLKTEYNRLIADYSYLEIPDVALPNEVNVSFKKLYLPFLNKYF